MSDDLFSLAAKTPPPPPKKAAESAAKSVADKQTPPEDAPLSVSTLANGLKRTLETTYGNIRVHGELSGLKLAQSGHLYGDIKDENANINIVCWRGTLSRLGLRPEEGMDVIIRGKVSSYPKSSRYQIVIDGMELAGEGALLKLLEKRKRKLAAEGLFDPARKKKLPFLPERIGVITSASGAVIRDIMHRLNDRFPRHVLLWPVAVQGQGAEAQITAAIRGFNALPPAQRPDLLIVARGGGSLEDLMAFNEENVVRAAAESAIPLISAVGHETDTTLIDYAADERAPTPTGAAERAVPVRLDLLYYVRELQMRGGKALKRAVADRGNRLAAVAGRLGRPQDMLAIQTQTLDRLADKLKFIAGNSLQDRKNRLDHLGVRLPRPDRMVNEKRQQLAYRAAQLENIKTQLLRTPQDRLNNAARMLQSLSPKNVLKRGYSLTYDAKGVIIRDPDHVKEGENLRIEFADNKILRVKRVKNA